jgi:hypothetical protein
MDAPVAISRRPGASRRPESCLPALHRIGSQIMRAAVAMGAACRNAAANCDGVLDFSAVPTFFEY